jgi:hypothetical protein
MHKSALFTLFAAAAAFAATMYAVAPSAGAAPDTTIRLFEHDTQQASLDLGGQGNNPGNLLVFAGDLFDHAGGSKLGRTGGSCMTTSGDAQHAGEVLCTISFMLARGQITGEGLFDAAAMFVDGKTLAFPITGGTGKYNRARGYGTVLLPPDVPNETDANFVLYLS